MRHPPQAASATGGVQIGARVQMRQWGDALALTCNNRLDIQHRRAMRRFNSDLQAFLFLDVRAADPGQLTGQQ